MVKIQPAGIYGPKGRDALISAVTTYRAPYVCARLLYRSAGQRLPTRVRRGEDARAGRWRNQGKNGIVGTPTWVDGKWQRLEDEKTFEAF